MCPIQPHWISHGQHFGGPKTSQYAASWAALKKKKAAIKILSARVSSPKYFSTRWKAPYYEVHLSLLDNEPAEIQVVRTGLVKPCLKIGNMDRETWVNVLVQCFNPLVSRVQKNKSPQFNCKVASTSLIYKETYFVKKLVFMERGWWVNYVMSQKSLSTCVHSIFTVYWNSKLPQVHNI